MPVVPGGKREALRCPDAQTEDQLGMFPRLELAPVDVKRAATHEPEKDVMISDNELAVVETQRETPIAATA
jgi:hypothetical protein